MIKTKGGSRKAAKKITKTKSAKRAPAKSNILTKRKSPNLRPKASSRFVSDSKQTNTLIRASREASINAIKEARAMGLDITYLQDGILYREKPDGTRKEINSNRKSVSKGKLGNMVLKKGMILHAKK